MLTHDEKQQMLNRVAATLKLGGVYLVGGNIDLSEDFGAGEKLRGQRQGFRDLVSIALERKDEDIENLEDEDIENLEDEDIENLEDEDIENLEDEDIRYRIRHKVGVRFVDKELDENDENFVLIEISAAFEAYYYSSDELTNEEVNVFAALNTPCHIWPYWREYIQSTCSRMGLDIISLPFQAEIQDVEI